MHPNSLLCLALCSLTACGDDSVVDASSQPDGGARSDSMVEGDARIADVNSDASDAGEEPVAFTGEEWAVVQTLAPESLPAPPADISNRYADDPAAAALGRVFFFEAGFSGALLDVDNDGNTTSLGNVGDTGRVACAGCHIEEDGFLDTRSTFAEISLGAGWTTRRTPSLLDVGQTKMVLWGGRHSTLHGQVFGPIENPLEMNSSRLYVAHYVAEHHRAAYEMLFGAGTLDALDDAGRFPRLSAVETGCQLLEPIDHPRASGPDAIYVCHGMPGDGAEYDAMSAPDQEIVTRIVVNVGKAIAAFERTLSCGPGRFDDFVHGDATALSPAEQRGLQLFVGKAECVSCHSGPYLSDHAFHNIGVEQSVTREGILNDGDRGAASDLVLATEDELSIRGRFSDSEGDDDGRFPEMTPQLEGAFRTPMLRCVGERPTFMHTGLIGSLDAVIAFFDRGGALGGFPGVNELRALDLTRDERRDLRAFLEALDGVP